MKGSKKQGQEFFCPLSRCWTRPNSVSANEIPPPQWIFPRLDAALPRRPLAHSNTRKERGVWGAVWPAGVAWAWIMRLQQQSFAFGSAHRRYATIIYRAPDPHLLRFRCRRGVGRRNDLCHRPVCWFRLQRERPTAGLLLLRERKRERVQSPLASNQSQLSYQQCAPTKNPMPFFPALIVRPGGLQEPNLQTAADPEWVSFAKTHARAFPIKASLSQILDLETCEGAFCCTLLRPVPLLLLR